MESRARFLGHPIHQQLVAFPLGLLGAAAVFDVIALVGGNPTMATVAYWLIAGGIVGALIAVPFGVIDLMAIPDHTRAARIGMLHGAGNMVVVALFAGSWLLRRGQETQPDVLPLALSFAGVGLALVTGWLGGELVSRLGIGVSDAAGVNASSSLDAAAPDRTATAAPGARR